MTKQPDTRKLTLKQEAFCLEYLKTGNASDAYRKAYGAENMKNETIWSNACNLLKNSKVATRIDSMRAKSEEVADFCAADVLNEVKRLSIGSVKGILNEDGSVKMPNELDDETAAMVASFEMTEKGEIKYKFWDKNAALEKAAKFFGMYEKDNKQKAAADADTLLSTMTASEAYKRLLNGNS